MGKCGCVRRLVVVGLADVLCSGHPSAMLSAYSSTETQSRRIRVQGHIQHRESTDSSTGTTYEMGSTRGAV